LENVVVSAESQPEISNSLTVFGEKQLVRGWQAGTKRLPYKYCRKTVFIRPKKLRGVLWYGGVCLFACL
jgi:hypothetical protein